MAENSKIEWTDHTFNPWVGCTKVSPACDHCYAEAWAKRAGSPELWKGERRRTKTWGDPVRWNRIAEETGVRARVFCASLADVFDNQVPQVWRDDLFALIKATPNLDWLLLTKRPQNIANMLPVDWVIAPYFNVWLGTTVENQSEAERRIPALLDVDATIHFLSCEPLLGPVSITRWVEGIQFPGISWVICGGESGGGKRPMDLEWARSLRNQCRACRTKFFMKQIDKVQPIPNDLMVREFPSVGS